MNWRERFKTWRRNRLIVRIRAEEQRIVDRDLRERAAIAAAFNFRYVGGARYNGAHSWMCPTCNAIHASVGFSFWVGTLFPKCCNYPEGCRYNDLPTKFNLKRPLGYCGPDGLFKRMLEAGLRESHPDLKDTPY